MRIALDLKKFLVDSGHLDINQSQLEHVLFAIMQQHGYDAVYTRRYKTLTRFHMTRRPLLVLVCGAPCSGMMGWWGGVLFVCGGGGSNGNGSGCYRWRALLLCRATMQHMFFSMSTGNRKVHIGTKTGCTYEPAKCVAN